MPLKATNRSSVKLGACLRAWTEWLCPFSCLSVYSRTSTNAEHWRAACIVKATACNENRRVDCLSKTGKPSISTLIYTTVYTVLQTPISVHHGRPLRAKTLLNLSRRRLPCHPMPCPCHAHASTPSPSLLSLESQTSLAQLQNQPRTDHLQSRPRPISSSHAEYRSAHSCRANRQPPCRRVPENQAGANKFPIAQKALQHSIAEAVVFRLDAKR